MIALPALEETRLIQPGSLARSMYRVVLRPGIDPRRSRPRRASASPMPAGASAASSDAAPGVQRWIDRIAMFLTLVGLTALLVGGVGVANAVRDYLDGKRTTIATLKCLGAPGRLIMRVYLLQIMILAMPGVVAASASVR